jgi:hypothetical protein
MEAEAAAGNGRDDNSRDRSQRTVFGRQGGRSRLLNCELAPFSTLGRLAERFFIDFQELILTRRTASGI